MGKWVEMRTCWRQKTWRLSIFSLSSWLHPTTCHLGNHQISPLGILYEFSQDDRRMKKSQGGRILRSTPKLRPFLGGWCWDRKPRTMWTVFKWRFLYFWPQISINRLCLSTCYRVGDDGPFSDVFVREKSVDQVKTPISHNKVLFDTANSPGAAEKIWSAKKTSKNMKSIVISAM